AASVVLSAPSAPASAGSSTVGLSANASSTSTRVGCAASSHFLRRSQGSGKRWLLSCRALALPQWARVAMDWEKPWHRPHPRVSATSGSLDQRAQLGSASADRPQPLREARPGPRLDLDVPVRRLAPDRLQVLEPRVGLFDQQQLVRFLVPGQCHEASPPVVEMTIGPAADGPDLR